MNVGDDLDDLLGDLTEEELLALDAGFDPNVIKVFKCKL